MRLSEDRDKYQQFNRIIRSVLHRSCAGSLPYTAQNDNSDVVGGVDACVL